MSRYRNVILVVLVLGVAASAGDKGLNQGFPALGVTFISLKGEKFATADLRGRVVLVNFWATDCAT